MQHLTTNSATSKLIPAFELSTTAVILTVGLLISTFTWAEKSLVASNFLVPFEMKYFTQVKGMDIELTQSFNLLENHQYRESIVAKGVLGKVTEEGLFHLSELNRVVPDSFSKKQKTIIGKRFEFQEYDWQTKKLNFSFKEKTGSLDLQPNYQDTMTHKQQLRLDLASGLNDIYYTVIKNGQIENYRYQVIDHEVLETKIGPLRATVLSRIEVTNNKESQDIQSKIWLASDWDYLMLKLETFNKDGTTTMVFTQGSLNGQPIIPLITEAEG